MAPRLAGPTYQQLKGIVGHVRGSKLYNQAANHVKIGKHKLQLMVS
jgi:hypothetical protein